MSDILKTFVREILNYERQYCLIHYSAFFGNEGHVALDRNRVRDTIPYSYK